LEWKSKRFFFEKKNQKTFILGLHLLSPSSGGTAWRLLVQASGAADDEAIIYFAAQSRKRLCS
jgi:hypothetical protein